MKLRYPTTSVFVLLLLALLLSSCDEAVYVLKDNSTVYFNNTNTTINNTFVTNQTIIFNTTINQTFNFTTTINNTINTTINQTINNTVIINNSFATDFNFSYGNATSGNQVFNGSTIRVFGSSWISSVLNGLNITLTLLFNPQDFNNSFSVQSNETYNMQAGDILNLTGDRGIDIRQNGKHIFFNWTGNSSGSGNITATNTTDYQLIPFFVTGGYTWANQPIAETEFNGVSTKLNVSFRNAVNYRLGAGVTVAGNATATLYAQFWNTTAWENLSTSSCTVSLGAVADPVTSPCPFSPRVYGNDNLELRLVGARGNNNADPNVTRAYLLVNKQIPYNGTISIQTTVFVNLTADNSIQSYMGSLLAVRGSSGGDYWEAFNRGNKSLYVPPTPLPIYDFDDVAMQLNATYGQWTADFTCDIGSSDCPQTDLSIGVPFRKYNNGSKVDISVRFSMCYGSAIGNCNSVPKPAWGNITIGMNSAGTPSSKVSQMWTVNDTFLNFTTITYYNVTLPSPPSGSVSDLDEYTAWIYVRGNRTTANLFALDADFNLWSISIKQY